jgi:hypothetical protein
MIDNYVKNEDRALTSETIYLATEMLSPKMI